MSVQNDRALGTKTWLCQYGDVKVPDVSPDGGAVFAVPTGHDGPVMDRRGRKGRTPKPTYRLLFIHDSDHCAYPIAMEHETPTEKQSRDHAALLLSGCFPGVYYGIGLFRIRHDPNHPNKIVEEELIEMLDPVCEVCGLALILHGEYICQEGA